MAKLKLIKLTDKGASLIEVMLTLLIVSVFLVALVNLLTATVRRHSFSQNQARATQLSAEQLELARSLRDENGLAYFVAHDCAYTGMVDSRFHISRSCSAIVNDKTVAQATVSWDDPSGSHSFTNSLILGDKQLW